MPGRLIVRRIPDFQAETHRAAGQDGLFDVWRFHAFFTTTDAALLDTTPVIGGPTTNDRVQPADHRESVAPVQGAHLLGEPLPDSPHSRWTGLNQQLAVETTDVEPQEVEPALDVDDAGLVLVEREPSWRQPLTQSVSDLLCLVPGVTHDDKVVGVAHQHR